MVLTIVKRDGSVQDFDASKILRAVTKAFATTPPYAVNASLVQDITDQVVARIHDAPTIEDVQDAVERVLMATAGCEEVAKHFILWRKDRAEHRALYGMTYKIGCNDVAIPWGPLGFVTYKRTYSRRLTDDAGNDIGGTEEFPDTIRRVLNACQNQLHCGFTPDELQRAWDHMTQLRGSVAGRFLWQLGTKTVDKLGLASTQNCAFTAIDRIECFTWIFDMLMLGCGVGFSIQKEHVDKLPPVLSTDVKVTRLDTADADFIVPDSREGWVSLLGATLRAYFVTGKSFTYSTILVRSAGKPIKGFGGIASGPEDLCKGLADLCGIVGRRAGPLRPIDCLDVVNIIAAIVVSGNVRRYVGGGAGTLVRWSSRALSLQVRAAGHRRLRRRGVPQGQALGPGRRAELEVRVGGSLATRCFVSDHLTAACQQGHEQQQRGVRRHRRPPRGVLGRLRGARRDLRSY